MNNQIVAKQGAEIIEQVLIAGDLSKLTPQQRMQYYVKVCETVGLNPYTKPFEYISLNGKLTLYALRACTDQLRSVHGVSVESLDESEREGVYIVTAKVKNKDGRTDMAKGAVPLAGLKGDNLANAMMKAETKAKRRATLSLCGLGFMDETEVETVTGATKVPDAMAPIDAEPIEAKAEEKPAEAPKVPEPKPEPKPAPTAEGETSPTEFARQVYFAVKGQVEKAESNAHIDEILSANKKGLKNLETVAPANYAKLRQYVKERRATLEVKGDEFFEDDN